MWTGLLRREPPGGADLIEFQSSLDWETKSCMENHVMGKTVTGLSRDIYFLQHFNCCNALYDTDQLLMIIASMQYD